MTEKNELASEDEGILNELLDVKKKDEPSSSRVKSEQAFREEQLLNTIEKVVAMKLHALITLVIKRELYIDSPYYIF